MVEQQPSKLMTRVRFPSPAPSNINNLAFVLANQSSQKTDWEDHGKIADGYGAIDHSASLN